MAGFLDSIGNLLKNPAVMELLPAVAGAAGGALSSPRLAGARGSIGRGLMGGAQGLVQGQEMALNQQKIQQEQQMMPAQLAETKARTQLIQEQTEQLKTTVANRAAFTPAFNSYLDAHVKDPLAKSELQMQALTDAPGALKQASLYATKDTNIGIIAQRTGMSIDTLRGLDPKQAADLAVKSMSAGKYEVTKVNTPNGVDIITTNKENPSDMKITHTGLKEQPNTSVNLGVVMDKEGNFYNHNNRTGALDPIPTAARGEAKGAVTQQAAMGKLHDDWEKKGHANDVAKANYDTHIAGMPGAPPFVPPNPDYDPDFAAWAKAPKQQQALKTYLEGYTGPAPSVDRPKAAPKEDLSKAPDWHKVEGATGPVVAKTNKPDGTYEMGGKRYVIKDGYGYKAD